MDVVWFGNLTEYSVHLLWTVIPPNMYEYTLDKADEISEFWIRFSLICPGDHLTLVH